MLSRNIQLLLTQQKNHIMTRKMTSLTNHVDKTLEHLDCIERFFKLAKKYSLIFKPGLLLFTKVRASFNASSGYVRSIVMGIKSAKRLAIFIFQVILPDTNGNYQGIVKYGGFNLGLYI